MNPKHQFYIIHHIPKTGGVSVREWLARHLGMHRGFVHYGVVGEQFCVKHRLPFIEQLPMEHRREVRVVMGHYVTGDTANLFPGRDIKRLVILREPVKRLISQYNQAMYFWCEAAMRPQIDFYEWFEKHSVVMHDYRDAIRREGLTPENAIQSQAPLGPNFMGQFLAQNFRKGGWPDMEPEAFAEKVNGLLESFWLVGITEHLGDFVAHLGKALGIPDDIMHLNQSNQRKVYLKPDDDLIAYIREHNRADILIYEHWKKIVANTS